MLALVLALSRQTYAGVTYDDATEALAARFTTPPTSARKSSINTLIVALKAAGIWDKLDALYITAAADEQAATRNWVADQYNLSAVNTPTFSADEGVTGNGSSSYYDTGFNPTTASSPKFTLNSASLGVWSLTNLANGAGVSGDMGAFNSSVLRHATLSGTLQGRPNNATTTSFANGAYPGMASWSRSASNAWSGYAQGAVGFTGTNATTSLTNAALRVLNSGGAYSTNTLAAAWIGSSLSDAEQSDMYDALSAYLTDVGAI